MKPLHLLVLALSILASPVSAFENGSERQAIMACQIAQGNLQDFFAKGAAKQGPNLLLLLPVGIKPLKRYPDVDFPVVGTSDPDGLLSGDDFVTIRVKSDGGVLASTSLSSDNFYALSLVVEEPGVFLAGLGQNGVEGGPSHSGICGWIENSPTTIESMFKNLEDPSSEQ